MLREKPDYLRYTSCQKTTGAVLSTTIISLTQRDRYPDIGPEVKILLHDMDFFNRDTAS